MNTTPNYEAQRRVLGMLRSLLDEDRAQGARDWKALEPADDREARALLNVAIELLLVATADPRLGGQQQVIAEMVQRYIRMEAAGR
jgi:hypothetical protein